MPTIIIKTQAELDALPAKFEQYTYIEIRAAERIRVAVARGNSSVVACDNSSVVAWENSSVVARGNSSVEACDNSSVVACDNSSVVARENSSVVACDNSSVVARENSSVVACDNSSVVACDNSSVVAWGNSSVVARGNSSVEACDNSSVVACDNSSVVARENSSVVACDNSSVVARENSSVVACDNSSVVAWGNSSVEARGNSSVVACENCCARLFSIYAKLRLHGYSVCFVLAAGAVPEKKSDTATVITPEQYKDTFGWLDQHGVEIIKPDCVILYKRVSKDYKTQEREPWETTWNLGSILTHPTWNPYGSECSGGKFHACPRPYFCDEFRNTTGDKYIAVKIHTKDLHAWIENPSYPNKIAFRRGKVLYEVDRMGRKIGVAK